ncbi:two component transcriptional regulator, AraC family [Mucilaginibacter paludis DSM 18603]|uniref:histidine kinase n=2 Tax=Mucilaginibacter TaxID=423349 RepID=H1YGC2_9SPHI|nr:two component transcriptional regulator, AraC family [Mucilaginibacter paludis DSM 18603]
MMQDAFAQHKDMHFTSLTSKDGLPSNTINAILKDKYGLIWFATDDGLTKFNGLNFTIYRHDDKDSTSLSGNEISSLHEDRAGRIWIGTNEGLHLYDRQKNCFSAYRAKWMADGLSSNNVKNICSDSKGNIWIATLGGVNMLDPNTKHITKFNENHGAPTEICHGEVLSVYADSKEHIWVGTRNGLFRYHLRDKRFTAFKHLNDDPESICGDRIRAITEDKSGTLWFGTGSGLSSYDALHNRFHNIATKNNSDGLSNNTVYCLNIGDQQSLWIGTENGLDILNIQTGKISHHYPVARDISSLSGSSVRSILNDRDGISWIGTFEAGVNKFDRNLTFFGLKKSNPYDEFGLTAPIVSALATGDKGDIYVGTDGGGLSVYHPETGLFNHILLNGMNAESANLKILALERTKDGNLWMGTYQNGLVKLDPLRGRTEHYLKGDGEKALNNNEIFCLKEDKAGRLWIGTNGGGVDVYDPRTGLFIKYGPVAGRGIQYLQLNGYIRALEQDRKGRMWIGSYGTGVAIYDPLKKDFLALNLFNGTLPSNKINTFLEDHNGNMWVGSGGEGLIKVNADLKKFKLFSDKNGLPGGVVHKILEDQDGRIWVSTNKGISWLDPATEKITNYSSYNGVQNTSFKNGAGLITKDGTLYFGGGEGLNYVIPKSIKFNNRPPEIMLTELKIGDKTISGANQDVLDADISIAKTARFAYKENFSISFVALNFTSPQENHYYYRLKGFDKNWVNAGTKTTAYYTNLSPGQYTFEVKATNNDGVWSKKTASLEFNIAPPFWMSVWAYLLYIILTISSILYLRFRGIQKLKLEFKQEQAERESARLHELDGLKIKFLTNLSHDLRTPISLIMGPVEKLINHSPMDGDSMVQLKVVKRNARRLLNLVNQLLDFRKIEERELKLNPVMGDVIAFIREACESFQDLSEKKQIAFVIKSSIERLNIPFDPDKLERIMFNLLSNAFKFSSEGGKVMVVVYLKNTGRNNLENSLVVEVTDTGIGIKEESQAYIFERFYQSRALGAVADQGSGIGLSIVKEFVQMHGGHINVESVKGTGTTFHIELPFRLEEMAINPSGNSMSQTDMLLPVAPMKEGAVEQEVNGDENLPLILIVEDNEDFRFFMRDNLQQHYKVIEATNGLEGWQKALACHPELIVSDVMMPYLDGLELSRKLKTDKRTNHIPVILLTASSGEAKQLECLKSGANDYLNKPFSFEILNVRIKNLLTLNRTLRKTYTKHIKFSTTELKVKSVNEIFLASVVKYIEDNLTNAQLSVEDLSRHIGMSRGSLYNKLLETTGLTPVEFIRSIKLEKAAMLLENSDLNIAQIAYTVGFATPNYFAKSFKSKYDMLPSEYLGRKRKQERCVQGFSG